MSKEYYIEIISILKEKRLSKEDIARLKIKLCKKHQVKHIPTDIEILLHAKQEDLPKLKHLQTKPTRSISGVTPIAVMSKPQKCPHGACIMCPSMTKKNVPQSYTGKEPATMRGIRNNFDPYLQVFNRLEQYIVTSHIPEKVELIIMGGTFPAFPIKYQNNFVKYCFKAMNDFSKLFFCKGKLNIKKFKDFFELPGAVGDPIRTKHVQSKLRKLKKQNKTKLETEQKKNERFKIRCVALCIETRPDYGMLEHGKQMLKLGCTRVELGIQSVYDDVLKRIKRGHTTEDTKKSIRILKDLGFKISGHYMPGLPGIEKEKDLKGMKRLFTDSGYKPDMLKIYPCIIVKESELYNEWKKGEFKPLRTEEAAKLIAKFKKYIPTYCRVQRIQRDIDSNVIEDGVKMTNLRQYIHNKFKVKCRCIRCREVGHVLRKNKNIKVKSPKIIVKKYRASKGTEFFISAEDTKNDILFGFCRLRFPSQTLIPEINKKSALIREIHVYSSALALGKKSTSSFQHRGTGKRLLETAESIALNNGKTKMVIISGIGVREYFRKFGYQKEGTYMTKSLADN